MSIHRLDNYLKTYRKRAALSQDKMAYLLGTWDGTSASRYEKFERKPSLQTALRVPRPICGSRAKYRCE